MNRHKIIPASHLILMRNNKILLLRRFNTGFEDGNYSLIASHVDPKETFTQAIIRETKEETGIIINQDDLEMVHMMHRHSTMKEERIDSFFIAKNWTGEIQNLEPNKCDNLNWFDIDNLPNNTIPYIKKAIENIQNKKTYDEYNWKNIN